MRRFSLARLGGASLDATNQPTARVSSRRLCLAFRRILDTHG